MANFISVDSTFTANVSVGIGSGCNWQFPDGIGESIHLTGYPLTYTVPSGKNLYINYANVTNVDLVINNLKVVSISNVNSTPPTFKVPIIATDGDVVTLVSNGCCTNGASLLGFLVDKIVEPITIDLVNNAYTIPSNKTFVLLNGNGSQNSPFNISLNGTGTGIIFGNETPVEEQKSIPIIFKSGDNLESPGSPSGTHILNGYLVDEDYFAGCGGGGSSSNALPNGTNVGEMMFWDGTNWVDVAPPTVTNTDPPSLMFVNGAPTWLVPVLGCTDSLSIDYSASATIDDGSCNYISIGSIYQGGIVIWIDSTGKHGLIADFQDLGKVEWGCSGTLISGADGTAIGTGAQNTIDIEAGCTTTGIAADLCANSQAQGYFDWFLPSIDELNLIYLAKPVINLALGNTFANSYPYYWASTEQNSINAYYLNMDNGMIYSNSGIDKSAYTLHVRAVRAF